MGPMNDILPEHGAIAQLERGAEQVFAKLERNSLGIDADICVADLVLIGTARP